MAANLPYAKLRKTDPDLVIRQWRMQCRARAHFVISGHDHILACVGRSSRSLAPAAELTRDLGFRRGSKMPSQAGPGPLLFNGLS